MIVSKKNAILFFYFFLNLFLSIFSYKFMPILFLIFPDFRPNA
jgi:hypothetical protein